MEVGRLSVSLVSEYGDELSGSRSLPASIVRRRKRYKLEVQNVDVVEDKLCVWLWPLA